MAPCMTSILALSVTGKIEQYGAYAGFASVLGLAVLSLLYFAQAREVKRLREWAGRAPERAADLQDRVQTAAQQRVVAQPQAQPRPAAATPAGQAQGTPGAAPATAAAAAAAAGAATATPGGPAAPAAPGAGQPTTVQPAANGAGVPQPKPGQPLRVPPSAGTPPPRAAGPVAPEREDGGRSIWAILGAAAALVVVVVAVVFFVFDLGGRSSGQQAANTIGTPGKSPSTGAGNSPSSGGAAPAATPKPGTYTVAVLNGTAVPGLARGVANRLQNTKFKIGNVTNAADQSRSATLVQYAAGHLAEAQAVAKAIDVGKDAIQGVDPGSRAIAGDQASVVVIVGADQNTSPQSQP
jgi:cbb3-type cytochrome oxidase subunit 3